MDEEGESASSRSLIGHSRFQVCDLVPHLQIVVLYSWNVPFSWANTDNPKSQLQLFLNCKISSCSDGDIWEILLGKGRFTSTTSGWRSDDRAVSSTPLQVNHKPVKWCQNHHLHRGKYTAFFSSHNHSLLFTVCYFSSAMVTIVWKTNKHQFLFSMTHLKHKSVTTSLQTYMTQ